nr:hypothetical protein [Tanacetum cinerariifolium]
AGALMIVDVLANTRSALSPNLVKSFIRSITDVAHEDAVDSTDLIVLSVIYGFGSKAKQILACINVYYPLALPEEVQGFLEGIEGLSKKDNMAYEILCKTLDGGVDSSSALSDSKIWVRHGTIMSLDADSSLGDKSVNSQKFRTVHDALLCRLYDDDLSVVQAVLNMGRLFEFIEHYDLLDAIQKTCVTGAVALETLILRPKVRPMENV